MTTESLMMEKHVKNAHMGTHLLIEVYNVPFDKLIDKENNFEKNNSKLVLEHFGALVEFSAQYTKVYNRVKATNEKGFNKALEIAVNQERKKDSQFDNKMTYYNFLVDAFYGVLDSSPMEMAEKNPELNNKISKLLSKLMEEKFGA